MNARAVVSYLLVVTSFGIATAASDKWTVPGWYISRQAGDELFIVEGPFKDQSTCEAERRAVLGQYVDKVEVNCAYYATDPEDS